MLFVNKKMFKRGKWFDGKIKSIILIFQQNKILW